MNAVDAAELVPAYVAAGVPVIPLHWVRDGACSCGHPCPSPAKHPLTRNGKDDATTDLGVIAEWFAHWPHANWGMRPVPGVIVIDIDPRNGGITSLVALENTHGPLPATLTAVTGSGGQHRWFTYRGPTRGRLAPGIDVKTHTGYVVAPPSTHITGGRYQWVDQRPAVPAPRWIRLRLNPPITRASQYKTTSGNLDALVRFVAAAPEGERNNRLYWAACRAHDDQLDPAPLVDAAVEAGQPRPSAQATVESGQKAPPRQATA